MNIGNALDLSNKLLISATAVANFFNQNGECPSCGSKSMFRAYVEEALEGRLNPETSEQCCGFVPLWVDYLLAKRDFDTNL